MERIIAPEMEKKPLTRNGWVLVHDVPLSTNVLHFTVQKRIEDFIDEDMEEYV